MTCARHHAPSTAGAAQITPTGEQEEEEQERQNGEISQVEIHGESA